VPKTQRIHVVAGNSSGDPGRAIPIAAIPLLRGDAAFGSITVTTEMKETREVLMNGVFMRLFAVCVPHLADPRFNASMDQLDASYNKKPPMTGAPVVPYFASEVAASTATRPIYRALGMHAKVGSTINAGYRIAYNLAQNFRRKERSNDLDQRLMSDTSLDWAMWPNAGRFSALVPDFDLSAMFGEVPLNIVDPKLPVSSGNQEVLFRGKTSGVGTNIQTIGGTAPNRTVITSATNMGASDVLTLATNSNVYAEMTDNGLGMTLSGFKQATKLQTFASYRRRFEGHKRPDGAALDDDDVIDQLMAGLELSDLHLTQPHMVGYAETMFRQDKRYSTTADHLDNSAVSGVARATVRVRVPHLKCGGIIVLIAEFMPQQMFERQADAYLHTLDPEDLPNAYIDQLGEIAVDHVLNREIDVDHADPGGLFAYGPRWWKWAANGFRIGGKFLATVAGLNSVERQRFWAVETPSPQLARDFYMSTGGVHKKVFLDETAEPFECVMEGAIQITGLTQFGAALIEETGNFDAVKVMVPDQFEKVE